ncbi:hypothetical protein BPT24_293 [Tenacibaculum phage pT24]|uniref:Uncharacterized protein n=1 Tax=Tenacibaculum phage pT24 TaxID=1880590 RepID=A0A1B4XX78_9CAUD|nr:hypothetical protein HYP10_gp234 [Tenacibaculum phage pT24]BAV39411.1 hypothetical protein BPT24_293 [Tenacibaculum phage pT24]
MKQNKLEKIAIDGQEYQIDDKIEGLNIGNVIDLSKFDKFMVFKDSNTLICKNSLKPNDSFICLTFPNGFSYKFLGKVAREYIEKNSEKTYALKGVVKHKSTLNTQMKRYSLLHYSNSFGYFHSERILTLLDERKFLSHIDKELNPNPFRLVKKFKDKYLVEQHIFYSIQGALHMLEMAKMIGEKVKKDTENGKN